MNNTTMKHISYRIILGLFFLLCGCDPVGMCIDADDFGFPKIYVSATGQNVTPACSTTTEPNQVSEWTDSGYVLTGTTLNLVIAPQIATFNAWSAWLNGAAAPSVVCTYTTTDWTAIITPERLATNTGDVSNAPCWFNSGMLLYALYADPNFTTTPNDSVYIEQNPTSEFTTFHLGPPAPATPAFSLPAPMGTPPVIPPAVGPISNGGWSGPPPPSHDGGPIVNAELYFKINDDYYCDNAGGYLVVIKSGAKSPIPGPIASVLNGIKATFVGTSSTQNVCLAGGAAGANAGAAQAIFCRVAIHPYFVRGVKAIVTIYIILTCIMFMFGMVQVTQGELVIRIIKMAIIMELIDPNSWEFFYNNLFRILTDGLTQVINLVTTTIGAAPGDGGVYFFDLILHDLFSHETTAHILAIMFGLSGADFIIGFFYGLFLYFLIFLFMLELARVACQYIIALMAMAMLIIVAPLFFIFGLFALTREYFTNWLQQIFSYTIQPIVLFAAMALFANLIMDQVHRTLGFRICYNTPDGWFFPLWQISLRMPPSSDPSPASIYGLEAVIPVPPTYDISNQDARFIDYPFLDPDLETTNIAGTTVASSWHSDGTDFDRLSHLYRYIDLPKIHDIQAGKYIEVQDLFVLAAIIYVMRRFLIILPSIARGLATAGGTTAKLAEVTKGMYKGIIGEKGGKKTDANGDFIKDKNGRYQYNYSRSLIGGGVNAVANRFGVKDFYENSRTVFRDKITMKETREKIQDNMGGAFKKADVLGVGAFAKSLAKPSLGITGPSGIVTISMAIIKAPYTIPKYFASIPDPKKAAAAAAAAQQSGTLGKAVYNTKQAWNKTYVARGLGSYVKFLDKTGASMQKSAASAGNYALGNVKTVARAAGNSPVGKAIIGMYAAPITAASFLVKSAGTGAAMVSRHTPQWVKNAATTAANEVMNAPATLSRVQTKTATLLNRLEQTSPLELFRRAQNNISVYMHDKTGGVIGSSKAQIIMSNPRAFRDLGLKAAVKDLTPKWINARLYKSPPPPDGSGGGPNI